MFSLNLKWCMGQQILLRIAYGVQSKPLLVLWSKVSTYCPLKSSPFKTQDLVPNMLKTYFCKNCWEQWQFLCFFLGPWDFKSNVSIMEIHSQLLWYCCTTDDDGHLVSSAGFTLGRTKKKSGRFSTGKLTIRILLVASMTYIYFYNV